MIIDLHRQQYAIRHHHRHNDATNIGHTKKPWQHSNHKSQSPTPFHSNHFCRCRRATKRSSDLGKETTMGGYRHIPTATGFAGVLSREDDLKNTLQIAVANSNTLIVLSISAICTRINPTPQYPKPKKTKTLKP